nr:YdcF family protein [Microvirga vignae]
MTRRLLGVGAWSLSAFCLIGFLGFLAFVYSIDRIEQPPETRADGIVAMTGGAQRIGDAIDLLAKGYAKRLLISGVNEKTNRDQISRLNPGQRQLFDCCVDLDYRARNTIGNAIETRRWAESNGFDTIIVVTSNYHMPRMLVELDHALPNLQKIPYPVAATIDPHEWWRNPATAKVLVTEYVKFLAVWVRTRFEGDPESSSVAHIISGGAPSQRANVQTSLR